MLSGLRIPVGVVAGFDVDADDRLPPAWWPSYVHSFNLVSMQAKTACNFQASRDWIVALVATARHALLACMSAILQPCVVTSPFVATRRIVVCCKDRNEREGTTARDNSFHSHA